MKRIVVVAIAGVAAAVALGAARRAARAAAPRLMERMARDVMPRCMDACFASVPQERREFMLKHCRAQLDRVAARYMRDDVDESAQQRPEVA